MQSFFTELKRRNVFRVAVAYAVSAWFLLQLADVVLGNIGAPVWVFKVILLMLGIGLPVAVLLAWAYELTPDGLKKEKDIDRSQSITSVTGKKLEYFTIGVLSLVVLFFVVREFVPGAEKPPEQATEVATTALPSSIAVLPFEDYSEKADQEYFSRGIAEEILNLLAQTQGLRVAARTSSFAFSSGDTDIREIGEKLGVETVLEGSIRKSGDTIRITAQLINIKDGYHMWSETYDRDYDDIFKIQDDIAASILASLKVQLLGEQQQVATVERANNLDAYSAFLIGKERMALQTRESIEAARDSFVEAIKIDPQYAPARASLALAWLMLERKEFGAVDKAQVDAVVEPQLQVALSLSPDLPEAIAIRGLHHLKRYRYNEARQDFDRAIELSPNYALAYLWRSETFYEQDRFLDMLADKEKAYALDPMSVEIASQLAYDYGAFWRPRDADRIIARMFELHPGHQAAYRALAANLSAHGHYGESALLLEKAMAEHPEIEEFREWHAFDLLNMGFEEEVLEQNVDLASFNVYLEQGRIELARELLEKHLAGKPDEDWLWAARTYTWETRAEMGMPPFKSAVAQNIAWLDKNNIPWRDECRLHLLFDLREAGMTDGVDSLMAECRNHTDERLKAGYLCPCSWFGLVLFATIDGRTDEAIERAREWLKNGDSNAQLNTEPIIQAWADRPEYQEILSGNAEQVKLQQQIYLAGVAARDANKPDSAAGGGH